MLNQSLFLEDYYPESLSPLTFGILFSFSCRSTESYEKVERWGVFELELHRPAEGKPYMEVELHAVFEGEDGTTLQVPGFYDGERIFRVRFSPPEEGVWSYITVSNSANLAGKRGRLTCIPVSGENHGPLRVVKTCYLQYADGSPYYGIGTTAYQWTSVKQSIQEKTLETLHNSPFNKIRMCVFPKDSGIPAAIPIWHCKSSANKKGCQF